MHGDGNATLVQDGGLLARVCAAARQTPCVAVDTEADSFHSYHHKLCLIQLSFAGRDFIVDPLVLDRQALAPLLDLWLEPRVVKLLHGADYDLRTIDRDLGARLVPVRDTQIAAQLLGERQTGLAALVSKELGHELDKRFQRANWGARPLSQELLAYAVGDTAYLERLQARLGARLEALGRLEWWEEECQELEQIRWEPSPPDELAFERVKGAGKLTGRERDRLAALHGWREGEASRLDVPPFRVLGNEPMLALAVQPPADLAVLSATRGVGRRTARKYGRRILRLLAEAPPVPPRPRRSRLPLDRDRERRIRQARKVRDEVAQTLGVDPGVLAPRSTLALVADRHPGDEYGLLACLGRRWRVAMLASRLLPLVAGWHS